MSRFGLLIAVIEAGFAGGVQWRSFLSEDFLDVRQAGFENVGADEIEAVIESATGGPKRPARVQ
jgi:hypothetical protein